MSVAAPAIIRWHLTKTETLPFHFGFHEKKPQPFEHAVIHRKSITRLEQHFYLLRQQGDVLIVNKSAVQKPVDEHKYEKEDKLADELTAGGGQGAVEDKGMYEKELADQAPSDAPHESLIASNKTFGAENATYDAIDEPTTVAAVNDDILSHLTPQAAPISDSVKYDGEPTPDFDSHSITTKSDSATPAFPPAKDDILNLPAKDETIDLADTALVVNNAGVPIVMPVAEPVEPTVIEVVKQADHPEVVDREEEEEAQRAAAQSALASGSLVPMEETLLAKALHTSEVPETETGVVQMPVAEPVGTVTTTLHAPHPSLDNDQLDTFAAESATTETAASETATDSTETPSLDDLRQQHEAEAAAAKAETERLEIAEISPEEREAAELELMSRTKRLAALHERIIRHQTLDAQGPDITAIKQSPSAPPTAASSKIMEIQQLHLAAQAESAVTHTVVEKSAPTVKGSRIKELAKLHEQKIKEEAEAKKNQDDLFAGKSKATGSGRGRRGGKKR